MPELRQNLVTKEWVIIATERARRPEEYVPTEGRRTADRPEWDGRCPFCPGNEELDLEVTRLPREARDWRVRVVKNKYPALIEQGEPTRIFRGVHRSIFGVGYHEILVESPRHNGCLALESPDQVTMVLTELRTRSREIAQDARIEHIMVFENHGAQAGTSLVHPHAQITALPIVPHRIRTRMEEARRHFDDTGDCVFCTMLAGEQMAAERIVCQNANFVAFVPFAATSPFHTWIMPRRHEPSFLRVEAQEIADLAHILRSVLRRLYFGLQDPDYNFILRSAPLHDLGTFYLHWYLTIIPRVTQAAGFELGSGMYINTALPEESAAYLRSVDVD